MKLTIIVTTLLSLISLSGQGQWGVPGGGVSGSTGGVRAMTYDTIQDRLYVFGRFLNAGDSVVNSTAWWDGTVWHPMGNGVPNLGQPIAAVLHNGNMVAGGLFLHIDTIPDTTGLALWNGQSWSLIGAGGANGFIYDVASTSFGLVTGGAHFIAGVNVNRSGVWDGVQWTPAFTVPDLDGLFGKVFAITEYQGKLIIGGNFNQSFPGEIGMVINDTLVPMGQGILGDSWVNDLIVFQGELYVAGEFFAAAGNAATGVMKWNGSDWIDPFPNIEFLHQVRAMTVANGELFMVGGYVRVRNGLDLYNTVRTDGQQVCLFGSGPYATNAVAASQDSLYLGIGPPDTTQYYSNKLISYDLSHPSDTCVSVAVSIHEEPVTIGDVLLYPNPAHDRINVQCPGGCYGKRLNVVNAIGEQGPSIQLKSSSTSLSLGSLPSGMFHLLLFDKGLLVGRASFIKE